MRRKISPRAKQSDTSGVVVQPGEMGWGLPTQTIEERIYAEKKAWESLTERAPQFCMQRDAKGVVNEKLLNTVRQMIKDDGWDDGFSFRYLFKAIFGHAPRWLRQLIGSCVASGHMRNSAYRGLAEVFLLDDPEQLPGSEQWGIDSIAFYGPYTYRAGRSIAGIDGNSDGSLCGPQIEGSMKYGHLPCKTEGLQSDDYPEPQNTRTYKEWGASDRLMDQFKAEGQKHRLIESEKVSSTDMLKTLLEEHFKPSNICSNWAFKSTRKDTGAKFDNGKQANVWTRDQGNQWAHNMSRTGWFLKDGIEYREVDNSWEDAHDGCPNFIIEADEDERWLRQAECRSVGEIDHSDNPPAFPE